MDARVCLAPRGTSVETFRVLEGLRCGCVVVGERLPRFWFYEGAPIVQLDRWSDLPRALAPVSTTRRALEARSPAGRWCWWRTRCSAALNAWGASCAGRDSTALGERPR